MAIQSRVKAKLEAEGYQVVTTRTSDTYVDLTDRSRAANASESDIFVSIHINASGSSASQGIETYYYQPYAEYPSRINATYHANPIRLSMSDTLANAIQSSLINATGAQNQGVKRNLTLRSCVRQQHQQFSLNLVSCQILKKPLV